MINDKHRFVQAIHRLSALLVCTLLLHAGSAVADSQPRLADPLINGLAQHLNGLDAPGAAVAIHAHDQSISLGLGFSDDEQLVAIQPSDRFRLASVTKLYLAAVVLQLVDEGVWSLDDPISDYVDGVPNGEQITLGMLGRHTSGLNDAIRQPAFHRLLAEDPTRDWSARSLVDTAFEAGRRYASGEAWAYANTNTILLGMAIEAATGKNWREQVRERILIPLDLRDTGFDDDPPTVHGYRYGKRENPVSYGGADNHRWFDAVEWSASWTNAAGEMTGTAADTARFIQSLFAGELLSSSSRQTLTDFSDTGDGAFFYGFHCTRIDTPLGYGHGHHGDVPGFSSSAFWLPERETAVVVLANLSAELDKTTSASKLIDSVFDELARQNIADELESIRGQSTIQNASVLVIRNGTAGTPMQLGEAKKTFRAGSVSKLLTALLVLRADQAGVVALDDPLENYLPGTLVGEYADQVTLAQLLEHTAGLAGSGPVEYAANTPRLMPRDYARHYGPFKLRWPPGRHYSYSNGGYTLVAAAVEQAWNEDFDTLMQREVFAPLGMLDTSFVADSPVSFMRDGVTHAEPWYMPVRPAGSAVTTVADLAKVVEMLVADGGDFLSTRSVSRLERGETGLLAEAGGGQGSYGLGTFAYAADGYMLRGHWGKTEGFRATLMYTPSAGQGYVLLVDTADDRATNRMRRVLDRHITQNLPVAESAQYSLATPPFDPSGLYANFSHDGQQRAWLFSLLDVRRMVVTETGLSVRPLWIGPAMIWTRVADRLYRAEGLSFASGAIAQLDDDTFWVDVESYRQVSPGFYYGQLGVLLLGLAACALSILIYPVLLLGSRLRRFRKRDIKQDDTRHGAQLLGIAACFALSGLALLGLIAGFVYYQFVGLSAITQLGRVSLPSLTLLFASVFGPAMVLTGLFRVVFTRPPRWAAGGWALIGLAQLALIIYLIFVGMLPLMTWQA